MMKQYLEETEIFEVNIYRSSYTWRAEREADYLKLGNANETKDLDKPKMDEDFTLEFKKI